MKKADWRAAGNENIVPILLNKCVFFSHFGPLCGPPVEMTKAQILIIIGIIMDMGWAELKKGCEQMLTALDI